MVLVVGSFIIRDCMHVLRRLERFSNLYTTTNYGWYYVVCDDLQQHNAAYVQPICHRTWPYVGAISGVVYLVYHPSPYQCVRRHFTTTNNLV